MCQNGFVYDAALCRCPCTAGFTGSLCENFDCSLSPTPDSQVAGNLCDTLPCGDASTAGICPHKCLCQLSTTLAPTTTTCAPLTCAYGLKFDSATCSCPCRNGFSGTLCETYNCNLTPTVDSLFGPLCSVVQIQGCMADSSLICPFLCLCQSTTAAP